MTERGAREQARRVDAAAGVGRRREGRTPLFPLPRPPGRLTEQEPESHDLEIIPRRLGLAESERRGDVRGALLVGEARRGALACPKRICDGTVDLVRARGGEVSREIDDVPVEVGAVQPFDRLGDRPVAACSTCRRQLVFERGPQERMCERVAAGSVANLDDDPCQDGLVEQVEQALLGQIDHQREEVELELTADEGCDLQHASSVVGQSCDAPDDHVAHSGGDIERRSWARFCELTELLEVAHQLLHEEGVAGRLVMDRVDRFQ